MATKRELRQAFMAGSNHERDYVMERHFDGTRKGFEEWYEKKLIRKSIKHDKAKS